MNRSSVKADKTNVPNCCLVHGPNYSSRLLFRAEVGSLLFISSRFEGLYSSKIKAEFCVTSCQKGQAVENKKLLASGEPSSSKIQNRQKGNSLENILHSAGQN